MPKRNNPLSKIAAHTLLNKEEERSLLIRANVAKDPVAEQLLIKHNIRLVINQAQKFCSHDDPRFHDLVQAGIIGLITAVHRFNVEMENRFSTFAVWWILAEIRKEISVINPKVNKHKSTKARYDAAVEELTEKGGESPSHSETILHLGWGPKEELQLSIATNAQIVSLDKLAPAISAGMVECSALVGEDIADQCVERVDLPEIREKLDQALSSLPPNMEQIVRDHYGYGVDQPKTYEDIKQWHGGTREGVRQLENRALRQLWGALKELAPDY